MSDTPAPAPASPPAGTPAPGSFEVQQTPTNTIGTLGFVFSILGFATCGLGSLLGLLLCFFGVKRQPNRLAKAGLVLSLLGIAGYAAAFALGLWSTIAGIVGVARGGDPGAARAEMTEVAAIVDAYVKANSGTLPSSLERTPGLSAAQRTDPWGHPYRYEIGFDGKSFLLFSNGPDGQEATSDDIRWPTAP